MTAIDPQLFQDATELQADVGPRAAAGCDAVVLFALGFATADFVPFAREIAAETPVLLADCYGILGFSAPAGRNLEFLEAGRGREYGGVGGDGGRGVVAVVFARGSVVTSLDTLPAIGVTSHLVIAAQDDAIDAWLATHARAVYYGGIAKAAYRYAPGTGRFEPVPRFWVSLLAAPGQTVGTTAFTGEATDALRTLLDRAPPGSRVDAVGLFPCFMRGKNAYGRTQVEPNAVTAAVAPDADLRHVLPRRTGAADVSGLQRHPKAPARLHPAQHDHRRGRTRADRLRQSRSARFLHTVPGVPRHAHLHRLGRRPAAGPAVVRVRR